MRHATTISSPLSISPFDSFRLGLRAKSVTSSVNPKLSNPPTPRAAFSVTEQQNDASQYAPLWPDSFKTCDAVRASRGHDVSAWKQFVSIWSRVLLSNDDADSYKGSRGKTVVEETIPSAKTLLSCRTRTCIPRSLMGSFANFHQFQPPLIAARSLIKSAGIFRIGFNCHLWHQLPGLLIAFSVLWHKTSFPYRDSALGCDSHIAAKSQI